MILQNTHSPFLSAIMPSSISEIFSVLGVSSTITCLPFLTLLPSRLGADSLASSSILIASSAAAWASSICCSVPFCSKFLSLVS